MNPYECVSFSTRPSSRPDASVPLSGRDGATASPADPAAPPPPAPTRAAFESRTRAALRSSVNRSTTTSKITTSPSLRRGHESARSTPVNSIESNRGEGAACVGEAIGQSNVLPVKR